MSLNIAIIFAKKEKTDFDRYTFPLLGRPVAYYPIHAALNASSINKVYLSTDSPTLTLYGHKVEGITVIPREHSQETLTEEIRKSLKFILNNNAENINTVTIQFANSPCITSELITNAISFLDENPNFDSVVTSMRRNEFNPARMFSYKDNDFIHDKNFSNYTSSVYFIDHRLMVTRPQNILSNNSKSNYIESILGEKIYPVIQNEGIWDIDYPWQIPHIEKWLRENNFSDTHSIYEKSRINLTAGSLKKKSSVVKKLLITTVPFGEVDSKPIKMLDEMDGIDYVVNPLNRKLKEDELKEMISDFNLLIAGTEPITKKVLEAASKLELISRVGIGLDSVDLNSAKELGIKVSYTPDAPSPAVAELTIAHMLNLIRHIPSVDQKLRAGIWRRIQGDRLGNLTIGIIGTGRVGLRVLRHLQGFSPFKILVNDLQPREEIYKIFNAEHVEKEEIYKNADLITLHVPLTELTTNLITRKEIALMKSSALLINTSRGGIINEADLYDSLESKKISGAAIDVFEIEPYSGKLIELENCYFTCHMGSMTKDCRARMEIEATEDIIRFVNSQELNSPVPEQEYRNQERKF